MTARNPLDRQGVGRATLGAAAALLAIAAACRTAAKEDTVADSGARAASPPSAAAAGATAAAAATTDTGWVTLFDGRDLAHWRGYKRQDVPRGWRIEGNTLAFVPGDSTSGGELVTREEYGDFELAYEWKVSPGGNSGVFYRAAETHDKVWETGPEMQVLDNARHPDGKNPLTSAGASYALYAPAADVTRPAGEWNEARIVARGPHVEHWLNGRKVVEFEQGSGEWRQKVRASKFNEMPDYGSRMSGLIALQDHGDRVWYRNIRVRRIGRGATR